MIDNIPVTTIKVLKDIKDTDIYIKHESESYRFEITKKAFLNLNKREQNNLIKLASHNFVIERK